MLPPRTDGSSLIGLWQLPSVPLLALFLIEIRCDANQSKFKAPRRTKKTFLWFYFIGADVNLSFGDLTSDEKVSHSHFLPILDKKEKKD